MNTTAEVLLRTPRLHLRRFIYADAEFIIELLNQPSFIEFIGDKGVRTRADACSYLDHGPLASYRDFNHGLYCVGLNSTNDSEVGQAIGMCGLLKRQEFDAPDLGFAFLPDYWGQGLAYEAAAALLPWEAQQHAYERVLAITTQHNQASGHLLERLGFRYQGLQQKEATSESLKQYEWRNPAAMA